MVLKTFNLDNETYRKFSDYCKKRGLSMSKQVDIFIKLQLAEKEEVREKYLRELDKIRKGSFIKVEDIDDIL